MALFLLTAGLRCLLFLSHVELPGGTSSGTWSQLRAWPAVGTQYIKVVINAYEIRSTERETERVCEVGVVQEGVEGVISVICSHTRFYLGKQRGEDNRKRGHVLKSIIYCCPDDILVTRKPPELVCLWLPIWPSRAFRGKRRNSKKDPGMRRSQMGTFISLGVFLFGCSQSFGWTRRDLQARTWWRWGMFPFYLACVHLTLMAGPDANFPIQSTDETLGRL